VYDIYLATLVEPESTENYSTNSMFWFNSFIWLLVPSMSDQERQIICCYRAGAPAINIH